MNTELQKALEQAWTAETSSTPDKWSEANKALGQCAVTALVRQDYEGGEILNVIATLPDGSIDSHYYNLIDDEESDLTRSQFPEGTTYSEPEVKTKEFATARDYLLSNERTAHRYGLLVARVKLLLHE